MKRITVTVLAILLLAGVGIQWVPALAQQGAGWWNVGSRTRFLQDVVVDDDLTVVDQFTAGDLTASDDFSATDDLTVGGFVASTSQAALTVADGGIITPTGTVQLLTAAGDVGAAMGAALPDGAVVFLINTVGQTITISETGSFTGAGDLVLAQFDTGILVASDGEWYEFATSNN